MQGILGPYYYGKDKWGAYLLDVQEAVEFGNAARRQSVRAQFAAPGAGFEQAEELRRQAEQLRHIYRVLESGLAELGADFEWGFTLLVDRVDKEMKAISKAVAKELGEAHRALKSPLMNQAQELFRHGEQNFNEGLWEKALKNFLGSEQKNEAHPLLQLQIGKLRIYGCTVAYNLVDLPEAEKHLAAAARYAEAKKRILSKSSELCGQAYFHAGIAAYLIGEQEQAAGRLDSMRSCLERALGHFAAAAALWPRFTGIVYAQAKCHALLGQIQAAVQKLEALADRDRRYFAKASRDGDFESLGADVERIFNQALASPGPRARAAQVALDDATEAAAWAQRSSPAAVEDLAAIELIERQLSRGRQSLPTSDVDIENLSEILGRARAELEETAQRWYAHRIAASQKSLKEFEARLRKVDASIESLTGKINAVGGLGSGCGFGIVMSLVSAAVVLFSRRVLGNFPSLKAFLSSPDGNGVATGVTLVLPLAWFIVGIIVTLRRRNRPLRRRLQREAGEREAFIQSLPELKQRAEEWKLGMQGFAAWQAQRPPQRPAPPLEPQTSGSRSVTPIA